MTYESIHTGEVIDDGITAITESNWGVVDPTIAELLATDLVSGIYLVADNDPDSPLPLFGVLTLTRYSQTVFDQVIQYIDSPEMFKRSYNGAFGLWEPITGAVKEAPITGLLYGRKDEEWIETNALDTTFDPTGLTWVTSTNVQGAITDLNNNRFPEAPLDGKLYARKDTGWHIPQAVEVLYNPQSLLVPSLNVRDAIRINTILILALATGVRARGGWDASSDGVNPFGTPDIENTPKISGDFWKVNAAVQPTATLLDINGDPLTNWQVGQTALWLDQQVTVGENAAGTPVTGGAVDARTVASVTMDITGTGYITPPTVKFVPSNVFGVGEVEAIGTAVLTGDTVSSITIDVAGSYFDAQLPIRVIIGSTDDKEDVMGWAKLEAPDVITADNVLVDVTSRPANLPVPPVPNDYRLQDDIDSTLWPITSNAEAGNVGKGSTIPITDANLININSVHSTDPSTLNTPSGNGTLTTVMWSNGVARSQYFSNIDFSVVWHRIHNGADFSAWSEIFSSDTRTSAEANTILDNADAGNIGKNSALITDFDDVKKAGFYGANPATPNAPETESSYSIIYGFAQNINNGFMLASPTGGQNKVFYRGWSGSTWGVWKEFFVGNGSRTSAQANTILTNADYGNWGKVLGVGEYISDCNVDIGAPSTLNGIDAATLNTPVGFSGGILATYSRGSRPSQMIMDYTSNSWQVRSYNASGWSAWKELGSGGGGGDFLPLTGGTMQGDIVTSNGISVNNGLYNAALSNVGKVLLADGNTSENLNLTRFERITADPTMPDTGTYNVMNMASSENTNTTIAMPWSASNPSMFIRSQSTGYSPWVRVTLANDLANYLPLSGGTISGVLTLNSDINIGGTAPFNFTKQSPQDIIFENETGATVQKLYNTGKIDAKDDIIAFQGQAATTNANRTAVNNLGKTTAYEMIDHLLDKIEELEARLANAGIA